MIADFTITDAHPLLVQYVDGLQRKNAEALSFYPRCVFERELEARRILLGILNGEPCGYLYHGAFGDDLKCHQVCIQFDTRRRLYGAAIVAELESRAVRKGSGSVTLRCGFDLDANAFWKSLGYECVAVHDGGVRRMRKVNVWRKYLHPGLYVGLGMEPAEGKVDASVWRKNKRVGVVTQFARGKAMAAYRKSLLGESS